MSTEKSEPPVEPSKAERARRRRAARILGDLLPETTGDETDEGWSEQAGSTRDDDLRRNVPPHHV